MSKSILIIGESGSGKTTSMRNLPPEKTYYIDCDGKGLSWKGWRKQYNAENKNYKQIIRACEETDTDIADTIIKTMMVISLNNPEVKYIVIDTLNTVMLNAEMTDTRKSYDKWNDIARDGYGIAMAANKLRDDLTVIILGHAETITEDTGERKTRMKTNGRKLEKIVIESLFTTVLLADVVDGRNVLISRQADTTAKAPMGAFPEPMIDNDIMIAIKFLEEY